MKTQLLVFLLVLGILCAFATKKRGGRISFSVASTKNISVEDDVNSTQNFGHINSSKFTCALCQMGAGIVLGWVKAGHSRDEILRKGVNLCITFNLRRHVCQGILESNLDILLYIYNVRKNTSTPMTSDDFCYLATYPSCPEPANFYNWSLDLNFLNDKPLPQNPNPPAESTMQVLHITDVHIDPEYTPGNNALCKDPVCCRREHGKPDTEDAGAGYWGDYRSCDTPLHAFTNVLQQAANSHPDVAYVAYTGDSVHHALWSTSVEGNKNIISTVINAFRDAFPGKHVLPVLGNHEPHPLNQFTAETKRAEIPANLSSVWMYQQSLEEWNTWLAAQGATILKGGYYSIEVKPDLMVIGLNNNFCYNYNWWTMLDPVDPADQLHWLAETLLNAEQRGQKVHILAHIPANSKECVRHWRRQYHRILHRFQHIIAAQFHGHEHIDYFSLYYDPEDDQLVTGVSFMAGSVTAYTDVNPSYRVYTVEAQGDFRVLDHETWYYNLTEANLGGASVLPKWQKLYSFTEAYGLTSILKHELDNFVTRLAADAELLDVYYRHHVRLADSALAKGCDEVCKRKLVCDIITHDPDNTTKCEAVVQKYDTLKSPAEIYMAEIDKVETTEKSVELNEEHNSGAENRLMAIKVAPGPSGKAGVAQQIKNFALKGYRKEIESKEEEVSTQENSMNTQEIQTGDTNLNKEVEINVEKSFAVNVTKDNLEGNLEKEGKKWDNLKPEIIDIGIKKPEMEVNKSLDIQISVEKQQNESVNMTGEVPKLENTHLVDVMVETGNKTESEKEKNVDLDVRVDTQLTATTGDNQSLETINEKKTDIKESYGDTLTTIGHGINKTIDNISDTSREEIEGDVEKTINIKSDKDISMKSSAEVNVGGTEKGASSEKILIEGADEDGTVELETNLNEQIGNKEEVTVSVDDGIEPDAETISMEGTTISVKLMEMSDIPVQIRKELGAGVNIGVGTTIVAEKLKEIKKSGEFWMSKLLGLNIGVGLGASALGTKS